MGQRDSRPLTLDTGALIEFERGSATMRALLREYQRRRLPIHIPASVVAQFWRGSSRQAPVAALLNEGHVSVHPLDAEVARVVGILCGLRRTSDIVDAHVVICARATGSVVITTDPKDLGQLDPKLLVRDPKAGPTL